MYEPKSFFSYISLMLIPHFTYSKRDCTDNSLTYYQKMSDRILQCCHHLNPLFQIFILHNSFSYRQHTVRIKLPLILFRISFIGPLSKLSKFLHGKKQHKIDVHLLHLIMIQMNFEQKSEQLKLLGKNMAQSISLNYYHPALFLSNPHHIKHYILLISNFEVTITMTPQFCSPAFFLNRV